MLAFKPFVESRKSKYFYTPRQLYEMRVFMADKNPIQKETKLNYHSLLNVKVKGTTTITRKLRKNYTSRDWKSWLP